MSKEKQVTITYRAEVSATFSVSEDMTPDEIKEEYKDYYPEYDLEDEPYIRMREIEELIVDGDVIDLN